MQDQPELRPSYHGMEAEGVTEGPDVPFEETRFTCPVCRRCLPWADMREGMRCEGCMKPYMAGDALRPIR